ncbi:MBOAT family protein [Chitinophaga sp. CF418]|uniref:MBOAT family O-acyltransferase n=1 Tax=Chitinophaga sp. CF418 TaxID=1855287 RepID=UPI00091FB53B|nr:MBOAT family O-acyltransferase [Chitinophaga sp. CF418]SHN00746.1 D-alanyl-lipoteichoic acid acyltransferase DltB, MBOAT superfamily [Chitinophaga sp. CF418]
MLFNSLSFAIFLPIIFFLYWFVFNKKLISQNFLLLISSYFFYACWSWHFMFLLLFSTLLDFYTGRKIEAAENIAQRKFWLWLSIVINLGFLGIFKYYNFFIESFADGLSLLGIKINPWTLQLVLPIGISFYTFHGLSYVIDIYKNRIKAEKNFVEYGVFVSFFPLLVAGPIERATHLLPQIQRRRTFDYSQAIDGMRQILWGLFKKLVIADNCAMLANNIFDHPSAHTGSELLLGAIFFAIQIYGDFSGYSDIALGTARLFGIELLKNFAYPYFSRDIAEFWRRWHISLSSWFRDYLYIPLGGSKGGTWMKVRNTFIIFLVSGFWHGANWTFIIWGGLNALYIMPSILRGTNRNNLGIVAENRVLPSAKEFLQILTTFALTVLAWIFFRSINVGEALFYLSGIFSKTLFMRPEISGTANIILILTGFFFIVEWIGRHNNFALSNISKLPLPLRWTFYFGLILLMFIYQGQAQTFIYFQF